MVKIGLINFVFIVHDFVDILFSVIIATNNVFFLFFLFFLVTFKGCLRFHFLFTVGVSPYTRRVDFPTGLLKLRA